MASISPKKVQQHALLSNFTPSMMAPQVLEDILVQRHELVADLVDRVALSITTEAKHFPLLIGARGMGKTHLVSTVYNRIKQREDLQDKVAIAWLREEEWGVGSWLDLVVRIFRSISEEYRGHDLATQAKANITQLQQYPAKDAEILATDLLSELVGKKTLFLIIENLDDIFDGLGTNGQQRFRSFLQEERCCTILATTPSLFSGITSREEVFYGWFHAIHLSAFSDTDAKDLLIKIAEQSDDRDLASFLATPAGAARVRAVHHLAGGNPRVYTLFAQLITKKDLDEMIGAFMKLLDDLMPYYQARMQILSNQQRKIIEYLVDHREAVIVKDIATWCFATPQTISSQLKDLRTKGYVISKQEGRESYYELAEVLMRLCLEMKKYRGQWVEILVDMLRIWYSKSELEQWLVALESEGKLIQAGYVRQALSDKEKFGEVLKEIDRPFEDGESLSQKFYLEGDTLCKEAKWIEAIDRFNRCLDLDAEHYLALISRGAVLAILGRYEGAIDDFNRAKELQPANYEAWHCHGLTRAALGQYQEAIDSFDRSIELQANKHDSWFERGNALIGLGKHEEAIKSFNRSLEILPSNYISWFTIGNLLTELDRDNEAILSYERAIELKSDKGEAWYNHGVTLDKLGRYSEAILSYERAIELQPDRHEPWGNRGISLGKLGRDEEAIASFERAVELKPDKYQAWGNLGISLGNLGKYEDAIASFDRALDIKPDKHQTWNNRGISLGKLGKYEEAIVSFERAIELQPNFHSAWHNKGIAYDRLSEYSEAIECYDRAIDIEPDLYSSWHDKGLVYFHLDKYADALLSWQQAFKIVKEIQSNNVSDICDLIQEFLDTELLPKFQQPAVRAIVPDIFHLYTDAGVLPALGVALIRNLKAIQNPIISEYTAAEWLKMWQELGGNYPEMELTLKMVEAGIKYKGNPQDGRIFLSIPQEMRPILREALEGV